MSKEKAANLAKLRYLDQPEHSVRDGENTANLSYHELQILTSQYLTLASALANGMPEENPLVFSGFYSSVLHDNPNAPYGRDFRDNDLSPRDTQSIRESIYEYFGTVPPGMNQFGWYSDGIQEIGVVRELVRWHHPVFIEEIQLKRKPYKRPEIVISEDNPDYQMFAIRVINREVHRSFEEDFAID